MRIIIIGILYIAFMLFGCPVWFASGTEPYVLRALTYPLFHANLFHLAVNCLSVWVLWPPHNERDNWREFAVACLISFIVYPLGFHPCVGFSNVLFATCGLRFRCLLSAWGWRKLEIIAFYVTMVGMCFFPQFAGTNHVAAYTLGAALAYTHELLAPLRDRINLTLDDARRFTAHR